MHVRQQIRDEIETRLSSIPLFSGRVQQSRVYTLQKVPGLLIYTGLEEAVSDVMAIPSTSHRELTVRLEIYSKAGTGEFDQQIDRACEAVEEELANDGTQFLMCKTWEYRGMSLEYSSEGEKAGGVCTLEYVFNYRINEDQPGIGV